MEPLFRDCVDADPLVERTRKVQGGIEGGGGPYRGRRLCVRGPGSKFRRIFVVQIGREYVSIPGTGIQDVANITYWQGSSWRGQEARWRRRFEGTCIIRQKPPARFFQPRERRIINSRRRAIVPRQRGFRPGSDDQSNRHNADQQQNKYGNQQGNPFFGPLRLNLSPGAHLSSVDLTNWD